MTGSADGNILYRLEGNTLYFTGRLTVSELNNVLPVIEKDIEKCGNEPVIFDLEGLSFVDTAGITVLYYLHDKLGERGITVRIEGADKQVRKKLELFRPDTDSPVQADTKTGLFESIGSKVYLFFNEYVSGFFQLAADITYWSVLDLFMRKTRRKGEFANQAVLIGVNAVLIVAAMSFIIGLVLALQSAAQLRSFGANIYIADLTVIAMMSEMGPLITAIMVAGRSGSSIAAEIATMKVTSETDALRTMGLNPLRFVVVPKMHGAVVTLPFLTIIADVFGIAGGMVIAVSYLDISPPVFIHRMQNVLYMKDIIFGIIKSVVFAYLIVITGSYFGFRVKRGAEGVGKVTTVAVVVSISLVIIADSIMGLIFY